MEIQKKARRTSASSKYNLRNGKRAGLSAVLYEFDHLLGIACDNFSFQQRRSCEFQWFHLIFGVISSKNNMWEEKMNNALFNRDWATFKPALTELFFTASAVLEQRLISQMQLTIKTS